jgi:hypothetical protein
MPAPTNPADGITGHPASCSPGGDDDGVDGQIVVAPGDILLPQNIYVRDPITYTVEKGWVTDIRGGLDAELVKSYMAAFNDPRGCGMSHVGWGMAQSRPRRIPRRDGYGAS